mmetsp:Transcript_8250/g.17905  ORF Transcript_8250/g.17905 Transcript_8250/m.17905 type:complete len:468 (+) Transcript_8250:127-1530(+)
MNNSYFAERNNNGAYRQNITDHDIRRQIYGSSEEYPQSLVPVTTVTSIASGGMTSTGSRLSGITSEFYDDNPWAGRDDIRRMSSPVVRDRNDTRGHDFDKNLRLSLTNLPGPLGTSGKTPRRMDSTQYSQLLKEGYSTGLALALSENARRYDFRFWVVDNSGSMQIGDGHRIVKKEGKSKAVPCTRWEEIKGTVKYHAQMASTLDCPTIFQLLNDPGLRTAPQKFSVCENGQANAQTEVAKSIEIMRKVSPSGVTPLTQHIWDVAEHISGMAAELRRTGKIVAIILATDGLPTDELGYGGEEITDEFIGALRSLEGLPVWTVIRLCTDELAVKQFYNSLDKQLEISLEVLDDYMGEAREVYKQNPWITYALPLHRCRELGYHDRLFDLIDERPLTIDEARSFCCLILGVEEAELPDPGEDSSAFLKALKSKLEREQLQWNPMKKKMLPWIIWKALKKSFSNRNCVIM